MDPNRSRPRAEGEPRGRAHTVLGTGLGTKAMFSVDQGAFQIAKLHQLVLTEGTHQVGGSEDSGAALGSVWEREAASRPSMPLTTGKAPMHVRGWPFTHVVRYNPWQCDRCDLGNYGEFCIIHVSLALATEGRQMTGTEMSISRVETANGSGELMML